MPRFDPLVLALMIVAIAIAAITTQRHRIGPSGLWMTAWSVLVGAGLVMLIPTRLPGFNVLMALPGAAFPVLILAGAYRYADRPVPRWLLLFGAGFCLLRVGLSLFGFETQENWISLAISPILCLAAAVMVLPQTIAHGTTLQRLLPLGLVVLAGLEAADALSGALDWRAWNTIGAWLALGVPVALFQFAANIELTIAHLDRARGERDQNAEALAKTVDELLQTQRHMERRIQDRTAELRAEVSERQRIEEALRISEERYRTASELASDYSYAGRVGDDGVLRLEWVTGAFSRITGYSEAEAKKMDWVRFTHPDDLERVARVYDSVLRGNPEEVESRIITKDGEPRWILARAIAVRDETTGDMIVYSSGSDTTEQRAAAEQHRRLLERVREAQKLESLGALAGGVAHDFNNLLSVILGNAAILADQIPKDSPLHSRAERIQTSSRMAADLTAQMLTYAGNAPRSSSALDLTRLVEEMAKLLGSGDHRIVTQLEQGLPEFSGDATQIRQVVLNLVTNATEALGDSGGEVRLRTGSMHADSEILAGLRVAKDLAEGDYVYLEVSDTGAGIDEDTLDRLFDPFFSTKFSGRGLGLAVVQGIVRSHGGGIRVESRAGEGTTFQVLFPAESSVSVAATRDAAAASLTGARNDESTRAAPEPRAGERPPGGTILVIDDEEPVRELAEILLTAAGFDVLLAAGGDEGLELYTKNVDQISLVVLDLTMPGMSGEEVLAELRKCERNIPILIASGYTQEIARKRTGESEKTDFIQKPYEPEALVATVLRMLSD